MHHVFSENEFNFQIRSDTRDDLLTFKFDCFRVWARGCEAHRVEATACNHESLGDLLRVSLDLHLGHLVLVGLGLHDLARHAHLLHLGHLDHPGLVGGLGHHHGLLSRHSDVLSVDLAIETLLLVATIRLLGVAAIRLLGVAAVRLLGVARDALLVLGVLLRRVRGFLAGGGHGCVLVWGEDSLRSIYRLSRVRTGRISAPFHPGFVRDRFVGSIL